MERIKSLKVENFQSHADTEVEFAEGVNVITGPSDEGKSALIRALRWVLYNEPLGDEFIQVGKKECKVTLEFENGYQIIRQRTPSKNRYIIVDPEGERRVLERIGRGVPEEIEEIHQMPKIELDTDYETTLNLDYQLDGPFLLNESGSNRAKALGRLLDVHLVDAATRNTNTDIGRLKQQEKELTGEVDRIEEELEEFSDLPQLKAKIDQQEELLTRIKTKKEKLENLKFLQDKRDKLQKEIKRAKRIIEQIGKLEKIKDLLAQAGDKYTCWNEWQKLQKEWQQKQKQITKGKQYLQQFRAVGQAAEVVDELKDKVDKFHYLQNLNYQYQKLKQEIKLVRTVIDNTEQVAKIEELLADSRQVVDKLHRLSEYYHQWQELEQKIAQQHKLVAAFSAPKEQTQIKSKIDNKQQKLKRLKELLAAWGKINDRLQKGQKFLEDVKQEKKDWLEEYKEILSQLGRCPTCFSEVNEQIISQIIANYKEEEE